MTFISDLFTSNGFEIRIAGGAVRDLLMGKVPDDIDFATTATPEQMKEMFTKANVRMINALGEKHGTITARINDTVNFEVTTLRIDKVTDGRRAEVEYTQDWQLDANRRDLTINSMFLGLDGTVYDYFDGQSDLKDRRVRFVGDAVTRIQEDYLRILRYFRFYGRIARQPDVHEAATLDAIRDNGAGLKIVSGERIWTEWRKILVGEHGADLTLKMIELGLTEQIGLPLNPDTVEFQKISARCQELGIRLQPQTLLAALLKDQEEVMHVHTRLRLSGLERDTALFIVSNRGPKPHPVAIRPYQFLIVDSKAKTNDIRLFVQELLKYEGQLDLLKELEEWTVPKFPVTGHHLKENGCPPGKVMSVVLHKLKEKWKESSFQITEEALVSSIPQVLDSLSVTELELAQQQQSSRGSKKKNRDKSKQR